VGIVSKGGLENKQLGVIKIGYLVMLARKEKCWFWHVLLHSKEWGDHLVRNE
jgi:hypothetical protein